MTDKNILIRHSNRLCSGQTTPTTRMDANERQRERSLLAHHTRTETRCVAWLMVTGLV
jgi:hypothetical protein